MLDALSIIFLIILTLFIIQALRADLKRIGILMVLLSLKVHAQETYRHNGQAISKRDAVIQLLKNPGSEILRCSPVELTEKMTLKVKKVEKSRK